MREAPLKTRRSDQAVNTRRPLRRRSDTIDRPARVRIRSRKPCTRARRRLFGWKVRLPLATAFSLGVFGIVFGNAILPPALHKHVDRVGLNAVPREHNPSSQPDRQLLDDYLLAY